MDGTPFSEGYTFWALGYPQHFEGYDVVNANCADAYQWIDGNNGAHQTYYLCEYL